MSSRDRNSTPLDALIETLAELLYVGAMIFGMPIILVLWVTYVTGQW